MDLGYYRTLIAVAEDCPVSTAVVPSDRGRRTVAAVQHEMIATRPGQLTQEDVLFETWAGRQDPPVAASDRARLREQFFARSQACLRSSPLPKRYGWGLLFDDGGRVSLCARQSEEYQRLVCGNEVTVVRALRSRRA